MLNELRELNGGNEYVFFSPRGREYQHVHKDSWNVHIKKIGYKALITAHGFRHLAFTAGQELLKVDHEIIQRQMAHTFGDKIRGSYNKTPMMEERRDFMVAWSDAQVKQGLITQTSCYLVNSLLLLFCLFALEFMGNIELHP